MTPQPSTVYVMWRDAEARRFVDAVPADVILNPAQSGKRFKHPVFEPIGKFHGWAEYYLTTDGTVAELVYRSDLPANKEMCHGAMRLTFSEDGFIQVDWRDEGGQYKRAPAVALLGIELAALCAASVLDGTGASEV